MSHHDERIADYEQLISTARANLKILKKRKKREEDGRNSSDFTPKAWDNRMATIAWDNMALEEGRLTLHALAVDIDIADKREATYYEPVIFRPSSFHEYKHHPRLPRSMKKEVSA